MADHEHTAHESTSPKFWITWLRFRPMYRRLASRINGLAVAGRRKLGLMAESWATGDRSLAILSSTVPRSRSVPLISLSASSDMFSPLGRAGEPDDIAEVALF